MQLFCRPVPPPMLTALKNRSYTPVHQENKGTERDNQGVGWDMSIPLKLCVTLDGNGSLFPQTSA